MNRNKNSPIFKSFLCDNLGTIQSLAYLLCSKQQSHFPAPQNINSKKVKFLFSALYCAWHLVGTH